MWIYDQLFTFLNADRHNFLWYTVTHQGATLQRPYQIWHLMQYIFSHHHRATIHRPWQSVRCPRPPQSDNASALAKCALSETTTERQCIGLGKVCALSKWCCLKRYSKKIKLLTTSYWHSDTLRTWERHRWAAVRSPLKSSFNSGLKDKTYDGPRRRRNHVWQRTGLPQLLTVNLRSIPTAIYHI